MNPFERFQIDHLSPSSLNCYAEQPAFWALKYLHNFSEESNASMWRGSAVEAGLDLWLYKREEGAAQKAALDRFELDAMGEIDDSIDKERIAIFPMLDLAMQALGTFPEPTGRQFKVEYWFDGIEVPIIGFTDYEWPEFGIDLKTTRRMPSTVPPRHAKQISLYQAARKKPFKLLYVTEKKAEIKEVEDWEVQLKRLSWHAHGIRRALSVSSDPHEVARLFAPDFDHMYWKGEAARAAAVEIWS